MPAREPGVHTRVWHPLQERGVLTVGGVHTRLWHPGQGGGTNRSGGVAARNYCRALTGASMAEQPREGA